MLNPHFRKETACLPGGMLSAYSTQVLAAAMALLHRGVTSACPVGTQNSVVGHCIIRTTIHPAFKLLRCAASCTTLGTAGPPGIRARGCSTGTAASPRQTGLPMSAHIQHSAAATARFPPITRCASLLALLCTCVGQACWSQDSPKLHWRGPPGVWSIDEVQLQQHAANTPSTLVTSRCWQNDQGHNTFTYSKTNCIPVCTPA